MSGRGGASWNHHFVDERFAVGVVDANPVVLTGGRTKLVWKVPLLGSPSAKNTTCCREGSSVLTSPRVRDICGVALVVGEEDARYFEGREVGIEELNPCAVPSVLIDDAAVVEHHNFSLMRRASRLGPRLPQHRTEERRPQRGLL